MSQCRIVLTMNKVVISRAWLGLGEWTSIAKSRVAVVDPVD